MTHETFAQILALLAAATGHRFSDEQALVWFRLLGDLPGEALQAAAQRALCEREYPGVPPLGLLRRYAIESLVGMAMSPEEAFELVREAIKRFGFYQPAEARHNCGPAIWRALEGIGGWERMCDSPIEQRAALFAQFRDAWLRFEQRRQDSARLPEQLRPRIREADEPTEDFHPAVIAAARYLGFERASNEGEGVHW